MFAWAGAALFALSLIWFVYCYAVRFAAAGGAPATPAVAANAALFTAFALHHSVFPRDRVRAWVRAYLSPDHERAVYVWVASLLFIVVCSAWRPVGGRIPWWPDARWVQWPLQLLGVYLTLRSAALVGVLELAGVRPSRPTAFRAVGPYGWVRHPIYTGWFLMVLAAPGMTWTQLEFAVVSCIYLLLAIPLEERSLRAATGEAYADYARKVQWKLVPGLY